MHPPGQGGHDHPHRHSGSALLGDQKLFDELVTGFDKEVVRNTVPQIVAAKLAEREDRVRRSGQSRYLVEPNVKDGKGRGCAICIPCSGSRNTSTACASRTN